MKTPGQLVAEIEARVRPTICQTFSRDGGNQGMQGRISEVDFDALVRLFRYANRKNCPHIEWHDNGDDTSTCTNCTTVIRTGNFGSLKPY